MHQIHNGLTSTFAGIRADQSHDVLRRVALSSKADIESLGWPQVDKHSFGHMSASHFGEAVFHDETKSSGRMGRKFAS